MRLILRGRSIIDWRRLHFRDRDEVDRFLRLCWLDLTTPRTRPGPARCWPRRWSTSARPSPTGWRMRWPVRRRSHDLFLLASGAKEPHRLRRIACIVLKVHARGAAHRGRDLLFRLAVSEADISRMVTAQGERGAGRGAGEGPAGTRVQHLGEEPRVAHHQAAGQEGERRRAGLRQDALPDHHPDPGGHPPTLYFLTQRLFPFNFVVPGQTENSLLLVQVVAARFPHFRRSPRSCTSTRTSRPAREAGWQRVQREQLPGAQLRGGRAAAARRVGCRRPSSTAASARAHRVHPGRVPAHGRPDGGRPTSRATALTPGTSTAQKLRVAPPPLARPGGPRVERLRRAKPSSGRRNPRPACTPVPKRCQTPRRAEASSGPRCEGS